MSRLRIDLRARRHAAAACAGLVLVFAVSLNGCGDEAGLSGQYEADEADEDQAEPARLESIKGTEVKRVKFSAEGARQVGLRTGAIREVGRREVIPYAAVIYDSEGDAFTYTSPERLTYVRKGIEIDRVDGDRVVLSDGPPAGTQVVTVGVAEVYGTEFEVSH